MSVSYDKRVLGLEIQLGLTLCEGIGSVRALTVYLLIKNGEWCQLLDLGIDSRHYDDPLCFSEDYLVTSFLSKNPRLPTGIDKSSVAVEKFKAAEIRCGQTNERLRSFFENPHSVDPELHTLYFAVQREIRTVLGCTPSKQDLEYCESKMAFGPGATTSLSGVVSQGAKYKSRTLDCTPDLVSFRACCFPPSWRKAAPDINIVRGSKLTTVPKNAKTDRVICIEPDLNIFVQKGVGALIRRKLARIGLNLQTQENNQALAKVAWRRGLATVDLKSASDTIASLLVFDLLPSDWVELLDLCRSPEVFFEGQWHKFEKWSSMGNGYTFELETLIFYCCLRAVVDPLEWGEIIAYGDDLILPSKDMEKLLRLLDFLGFEVNREKTFGNGLFHESCGADFFRGHNVRPFFLRSEHEDFESICYLYANNARRWSSHHCGGYSCDARLLPLWLRCYSSVAKHLRYKIPEGFGDVGFVTDFDRARPYRASRKRGWSGWRFAYRRIRAVERRISEFGVYLSNLNGSITEFSLGREALRGRFRHAVKAHGYVLQWPCLGPWL